MLRIRLRRQGGRKQPTYRIVVTDQRAARDGKFVEIIGEDEISILDPETIYFITNILNKAKLIKFRKLQFRVDQLLRLILIL